MSRDVTPELRFDEGSNSKTSSHQLTKSEHPTELSFLDDDALLEDQIEGRRKAFGMPCIAVGVAREGEIVWFRGFGETELGNGKKPDANSRFRIASNTKTFTATALMSMSETSMLSLDDPLLLHIPEFTSAATPAGDLEDITLRRLATHHSGLVTEHPDTEWSAHRFPEMGHITDTIHAVEMVLQADGAWKYSNLAYGLLGEVVSRLSGIPYRRWIADELLDPLGMIQTCFDANEVPDSDNVTGYVPPRPGGNEPRVAPVFDLNGMDAAGQLWSSVSDLAKWIGFMTSSDPQAFGVAVTKRSIAEMLRPVYISDRWSLGQCIGWRATRRGDRVYHGHGGGVHGFGTATLWSRTENIGVIVLSSLWPTTGAGTIATELLDMLLDGSPLVQHPQESADPRIQPAADPTLSHLDGTYFAEPGLTRTVTATSDDTLHLGFEDSGILGRIPVAARKTAGVAAFTVLAGRAGGETITFDDQLNFRMSNFSYERIDNA